MDSKIEQQSCACGPRCACSGEKADDASRPASSPTMSPTASRLVALQRSAGNRAVLLLLHPRPTAVGAAARAAEPPARSRATVVQREDDDATAEPPPEPLPAGPFEGEEHTTTVHGQTFSFQGRANATYAHSWDHRNPQVQGTTRTGDLVETFSVTTTVSLPPMPTGLSDCERPIVDDAINTRLAAHEQQHVTAFEAYNGTTTSPYSVQGNAQAVTAALAQRHTTNEAARRSAADTASRALDPFMIDVDTSSCDPPQEEAETESSE